MSRHRAPDPFAPLHPLALLLAGLLALLSSGVALGGPFPAQHDPQTGFLVEQLTSAAADESALLAYQGASSLDGRYLVIRELVNASASTLTYRRLDLETSARAEIWPTGLANAAIVSGRFVYLVTRPDFQSSYTGLVRVDLETLESRSLGTSVAPMVGDLAVDADGRYVVYRTAAEIRRLSLADGQDVVIQAQASSIGSFRFHPTNPDIYFYLRSDLSTLARVQVGSISQLQRRTLRSQTGALQNHGGPWDAAWDRDGSLWLEMSAAGGSTLEDFVRVELVLDPSDADFAQTTDETLYPASTLDTQHALSTTPARGFAVGGGANSALHGGAGEATIQLLHLGANTYGSPNLERLSLAGALGADTAGVALRAANAKMLPSLDAVVWSAPYDLATGPTVGSGSWPAPRNVFLVHLPSTTRSDLAAAAAPGPGSPFPVGHRVVIDTNGSWRVDRGDRTAFGDGRTDAIGGAFVPSADAHDMADVDGDGVDDRLASTWNGTAWTIEVDLSSGPSGTGAAAYGFGDGVADDQVTRPGVADRPPAFADIDGDGRADVVLATPQGTTALLWQAWRTEGAGIQGSATVTWSGYHGDPTLDRARMADVNGDGRADRVLIRPELGGWGFRVDLAPGPGPGSGGGPAGFGDAVPDHLFVGGDNTTDEPLVADVDGDGRADLLLARQQQGGLRWFVARTGPSGLASGWDLGRTSYFGADTGTALVGHLDRITEAWVPFPQEGDETDLPTEIGDSGGEDPQSEADLARAREELYGRVLSPEQHAEVLSWRVDEADWWLDPVIDEERFRRHGEILALAHNPYFTLDAADLAAQDSAFGIAFEPATAGVVGDLGSLRVAPHLRPDLLTLDALVYDYVETLLGDRLQAWLDAADGVAAAGEPTVDDLAAELVGSPLLGWTSEPAVVAWAAANNLGQVDLVADWLRDLADHLYSGRSVSLGDALTAIHQALEDRETALAGLTGDDRLAEAEALAGTQRLAAYFERRGEIDDLFAALATDVRRAWTDEVVNCFRDQRGDLVIPIRSHLEIEQELSPSSLLAQPVGGLPEGWSSSPESSRGSHKIGPQKPDWTSADVLFTWQQRPVLEADVRVDTIFRDPSTLAVVNNQLAEVGFSGIAELGQDGLSGTVVLQPTDRRMLLVLAALFDFDFEYEMQLDLLRAWDGLSGVDNRTYTGLASCQDEDIARGRCAASYIELPTVLDLDRAGQWQTALTVTLVIEPKDGLPTVTVQDSSGWTVTGSVDADGWVTLSGIGGNPANTRTFRPFGTDRKELPVHLSTSFFTRCEIDQTGVECLCHIDPEDPYCAEDGPGPDDPVEDDLVDPDWNQPLEWVDWCLANPSSAQCWQTPCLTVIMEVENFDYDVEIECSQKMATTPDDGGPFANCAVYGSIGICPHLRESDGSPTVLAASALPPARTLKACSDGLAWGPCDGEPTGYRFAAPALPPNHGLDDCIFRDGFPITPCDLEPPPAQLPNLVLSGLVVSDPTTEGDDPVVSFTVRNASDITTPNAEMEVTFRTPQGDFPIRRFVGSLAANISRAFQVRGSEAGYLAVPGFHLVEVDIDHLGQITESSEADNQGSRPFEGRARSGIGVDLSINGLAFSPVDPASTDPIRFTWTTVNDGDEVLAEAVDLRLELLNLLTGQRSSYFFSVGGPLVPGSPEPGILVLPNLAVGDYRLSVTVDPGNQVAESVESNNGQSRYFDVGDGSVPCLPCTSGEPNNSVGTRLCLDHSNPALPPSDGARWRCMGVRTDGTSCDGTGLHPNGWTYDGPRCPDPSTLPPGLYPDACGNPNICPGADF